jgi:hypothetical protein
MSLDEAFNNDEGYEELANITKWGKTGVPYCLYRNKLQYRAGGEDNNTFYCCSEMPSCDYFKTVSNKSYCLARYLIKPPSIDRGEANDVKN